MAETPTLTVNFDRATVELDAVQRAVYAKAREMTVDIRAVGDDWSCQIFPEPGADPACVAAALRREVNDQTLRARIAAETAPIRDLVFAVAFSQTGLVSDDS